MSSILATRRHPILQARQDQLDINLLAYYGGTPYIDARLSRFPAESDVDFCGDSSTGALGRKGRAFLINYVRRIAAKINQYVFKQPVDRTGIDPRFQADVTTTGMTINQFMQEVSALMTIGRWCWIGIDRPQAPEGRSVADREAAGDRIYWQLYAPQEVVDWCYGANGKLLYLITERCLLDNSNPRSDPVRLRVRYLYERGQVTRFELSADGSDIKNPVVTPLAIQEIPFVQCGIASDMPWWMDDIERMQRAIMDLLSSRDTQIFKTVFAQMVVGSQFAQQNQAQELSGDQIRHKMGTGTPLVEGPDERGITRYLNLPGEVFQIIQDAKKDLEASIDGVTGLAMAQADTRLVESAEAKQWNNLDPEAVLTERATMLQEIEEKCVALSTLLGGPVFTPYAPVYKKQFDIGSFAADMASIVQASTLLDTPKAGALVRKLALRSFGREMGAEEAEVAAAEVEIDQEMANMIPV